MQDEYFISPYYERQPGQLDVILLQMQADTLRFGT